MGFQIENGVLVKYTEEPGATEVVLPPEVAIIGKDAFVNCTHINKLTVSENFKDVEPGAFRGCTGFADENGFIVVEGALMGYCGEETELTTPDTAQIIWGGAFTGNTKIKSVVISGKTTHVLKQSFEGCTNLTRVVFRNGLEQIGMYAFAGCSALSEISFPGSLRQIAACAFWECTALKEIVLPAGVTEIGGDAFGKCSSLEKITLPDTIPEISFYCFYECENLKDVTITETEAENRMEIGLSNPSINLHVPSLQKYMQCRILCQHNLYVDGKPVREAVIPESLTPTVLPVFSGCQSLERITIGSSAAGLPDYAFRNCSNLKSVTISEGVSFVGMYAFDGCSSLADITIPESVTGIGRSAFLRCSSLTSITIPKDVKQIEAGLFYDCCSLKEVTILGETAIAETSFHGCRNLKRFVLRHPGLTAERNALQGLNLTDIDASPDVWKKLSAAMRKNLISDAAVALFLTKPDEQSTNMRAILADYTGGKAVRGNYLRKYSSEGSADLLAAYLHALKKPLPLDELDAYISEFSGAAAEICAVWLNYKKEHYSKNDVEKAEQETFEKELGFKERTVADWRKLFKFSYEDGGAVISQYKGNDTDVVIPEKIGSKKVIAIGKYAFSCCSKMKSILIPDSIVRIGEWAFVECKHLSSVTIPGSVQSIGEHAFTECGNLTSVALPNGLQTISNGLFSGCPNLTDIRIPDSVTVIEQSAFARCKKLEHIAIPNSVTEIGSSAFYKCGKLESIIISKNLKGINEGMLADCSSLKEILIPASVTKIGAWAFQGCSSLTEITIPENLKELDPRAFEDCTKLKVLTLHGKDIRIEYVEMKKCPVTFRIPAGSRVELYAKNYGIPYEYISE